MSTSFTIEEMESIRATPRPSESAAREQDRGSFHARLGALDSVLDGATVLAAVERWGIPRSTLSRLISNALSFDATNKRVGYRACIPHMRFGANTASEAVIPAKGHASAFDSVLRVIPAFAQQVHRFSGALPGRTKRSPSFDRLHDQMVKILKNQGYESMYPLNTSDQGRRALKLYICRLRDEKGAALAEEIADDPSATRTEHLFPIRPFDRIEYDEHSVDIEAWVAMPMADGSFRLERISRIWLLAIIDVGSGAILGWHLVVGRKYDRYDVLTLFARIMQPWTQRELTGSDMRYSTNAWMPSSYLVDNTVMRSAMVAMDNDSSHLAKTTVDNLMDYHMGVLHFGRSGMGEGRPYIEALFKRIEDGLLRYVAGGYSPATNVNDMQVTSTLDGQGHPLLLEVFEDLIDTYVTAHNVTSRSTREPRSPKRLIDEHLGTGAWVWHAPGTEQHLRKMTVKRVRVTFRGSKKRGIPPVVYLDNARYRSPKLAGQWGLIGTSFDATYEDWQDARKLTLWSEDGKQVITLHALAPFAAVPHTLAVRRRAVRWANNPASQEGDDLDIKDNILAYHAAVRRAAAGIRDAGSKLATGEVPHAAPETKAVPIESPLKGLATGSFRVRLR